MKNRLISCDFLNASPFMNNLSNKAKLLYLLMIANADDLGFVNNTYSIMGTLTFKDDTSGETNLSLLKNDYISSLLELIDKSYIYQFSDKHGNEIHLIKHWFIHNRCKSGLRTNYYTFYCKVQLINNEYYPKESSKENKTKQNKLNQNNLNQSDDEWNDLMDQLEETERKEEE